MVSRKKVSTKKRRPSKEVQARRQLKREYSAGRRGNPGKVRVKGLV